MACSTVNRRTEPQDDFYQQAVSSHAEGHPQRRAEELTQGFIYTLIVYSGTKGQRDPIGIHQSTQVLGDAANLLI
jgi:hypothetical protein